MDGVPLWVPAVSLLGGIVLYASTVRPRVWVLGRELVMRNMLSTIHIPLAAIEEVVVRQVMAVRAGGKRYVCAGVGRTLRQAMKGSALQRAREQMGGLRGELATAAVKNPRATPTTSSSGSRSSPRRTGCASGSSGSRPRPTSWPGRSAASRPGRRSSRSWRPGFLLVAVLVG